MQATKREGCGASDNRCARCGSELPVGHEGKLCPLFCLARVIKNERHPRPTGVDIPTFRVGDDVRVHVERECAGGCGAVITYELIAEFSRSAPEVSVLGARPSFRGGHLCGSCDMKIGDALRGDS